MLQRTLHRAAQRVAMFRGTLTPAPRSQLAIPSVMFATDASSSPDDKQHPSMHVFSTPSHFPENILAAGGGFHDDITAGMASPEQLQQIYDQLKRDMDYALEQQGTKISFDSAAAEHFHLDPHLDEIAVKSFSESSAFPEFTPTEDGLLVQTHGAPPTAEELEKMMLKRPAPFDSAAAEHFHLDPHLDEIAVKSFSESSVFPEFTPTEDVLLVQTHGVPPTAEELELLAQSWKAQEGPMTQAQRECGFSAPSDFPDFTTADEAIASRKRTVLSG